MNSLKRFRDSFLQWKAYGVAFSWLEPIQNFTVRNTVRKAKKQSAKSRRKKLKDS